MTTTTAYRRLRWANTCSRCRRRRARRGKTKCSACAVAQKVTDRAGSLRRKYELTPGELQRMHRSQRGRCFACRRRLNRGVIDHDHHKCRVRAVLCRPDNLIEGMLKQMGVRTRRQLMLWAWRMVALRMVARW